MSNDAKNTVSRAWIPRSFLVATAAAAILAAGCASDARRTSDDLKTNTSPTPITSYSPEAVEMTTEKPGTESAPAVAEQSPGARALGPAAPAAGPAAPASPTPSPGSDLNNSLAVNPTVPTVDPTSGLRGGAVAVTGTPTGGGVAAGAVGTGGVASAPAAGTGATANSGMIVGGTGATTGVAGPATTGVSGATSSGIAANSAAAAGNGVTGIAGGAPPVRTADGALATTPGVAGPAVVSPGSVGATGAVNATAAGVGATGATGVAGGPAPTRMADGTVVVGPGVAGPAAVTPSTVANRGAIASVTGSATVTTDAVAGTTVVPQESVATITNNNGRGAVRVAPSTGATAAGTATRSTTADAPLTDASGRTIAQAPRASANDTSRYSIDNNSGRTTPRVVETRRARSIFPWRNRAAVTGTIGEWNALSRSVAQQMIARYGQPDEVTNRRLIWHARAPWKRIEVVNETSTQQEPRPDANVLVQTIDYPLTPAQAEEIMQFDGSLVVDAVRGELSARGESEAANLLALNLVDEIVRGIRSAAAARAFFVEAMRDGARSPYRERLLFSRAPQVSAR